MAPLRRGDALNMESVFFHLWARRGEAVGEAEGEGEENCAWGERIGERRTGEEILRSDAVGGADRAMGCCR